MTDEVNVARWCAEHDQHLKSVQYGPLVFGLPDTWESITYHCGCVVYPEVDQSPVTDLIDSLVRQDFPVGDYGV